MMQFEKLCAYALLIMGLTVVHTFADDIITPKDALHRLVEGNQRYVNGNLLHPNRSQESREAVAAQQRPFACILGCSDSRVPPEILFDQGIGDLFVVRVAGNVAGPLALDSVDFAVSLGASLILVLGHENCGAVRAVIDNKTAGIETVAALIQKSIRSSESTNGDTVEAVVKANVLGTIEVIKRSPALEELIKSGKVMVVGGYYHFTDGSVELLH